jgi:biotin operon repressor/anti-sigma regulatory factor (Ser/Thr protein kinase)
MNTKERILKYLKERQSVTGKELSEFLGISRQAVNKHLKELIQNGSVAKEGTTRGTVYKYPSGKRISRYEKRLKKTYFLAGLEEGNVFNEFKSFLGVDKELSENAVGMFHYAFTKILNNAIDHSLSEKCSVQAYLDQYKLGFCIRDHGIGIFYSIFEKFDLPDENAAVGELIKGKTTTMKEKHTGEGIFFTSRVADMISFRSHKIKLVFDNQKKDVFVEEKKSIRGTEVVFSISKKSKRKMNEIFAQFAPEEFDYRFERTRALVKLFNQDYISRSEAKRLLYGLDKFKEIILDFEGVKSIGQGFADEIFRVFKRTHPHIIIKTENLSPTLKPIIYHVVDNNI